MIILIYQILLTLFRDIFIDHVTDHKTSMVLHTYNITSVVEKLHSCPLILEVPRRLEKYIMRCPGTLMWCQVCKNALSYEWQNVVFDFLESKKPLTGLFVSIFFRSSPWKTFKWNEQRSKCFKKCIFICASYSNGRMLKMIFTIIIIILWILFVRF